VNLVARLALGARRAGRRLVLVEVSAELAELLDLAGLPVEVQRQAERGEEALRVEGVEEEVEPGDLPG
jgi:hypothetical protein